MYHHSLMFLMIIVVAAGCRVSFVAVLLLLTHLPHYSWLLLEVVRKEQGLASYGIIFVYLLHHHNFVLSELGNGISSCPPAVHMLQHFAHCNFI
jgi:hypothetical protein